MFAAALADRGVQLRSRAVGNGAVPPQAKLLAVHDSAPLDVLRLVNKHSDNYVAESVLKTLGAESRAAPAPASWADGLAAMHAQLARIGLTPDSYRSDNGSGLFGSTEVSASSCSRSSGPRTGTTAWARTSWPRCRWAASDGTLRAAGGPAGDGRVRAKTGTLDKVSSLAGYIGVDGGHLLAFAILVNDIVPQASAAPRPCDGR